VSADAIALVVAVTASTGTTRPSSTGRGGSRGSSLPFTTPVKVASEGASSATASPCSNVDGAAPWCSTARSTTLSPAVTALIEDSSLSCPRVIISALPRSAGATSSGLASRRWRRTQQQMMVMPMINTHSMTAQTMGTTMLTRRGITRSETLGAAVQRTLAADVWLAPWHAGGMAAVLLSKAHVVKSCVALHRTPL
jgi:hypothetical protein